MPEPVLYALKIHTVVDEQTCTRFSQTMQSNVLRQFGYSFKDFAECFGWGVRIVEGTIRLFKNIVVFFVFKIKRNL